MDLTHQLKAYRPAAIKLYKLHAKGPATALSYITMTWPELAIWRCSPIHQPAAQTQCRLAVYLTHSGLTHPQYQPDFF